MADRLHHHWVQTSLGNEAQSGCAQWSSNAQENRPSPRSLHSSAPKQCVVSEFETHNLVGVFSSSEVRSAL